MGGTPVHYGLKFAYLLMVGDIQLRCNGAV
jgi:hypothetical protein